MTHSRVSYPMAFRDPKIYQLVISGGLRMTATALGIQASRLYTELNHNKTQLRIAPVELIEREVYFFAGISLGGICSVILYVTIFQRKQYLMFVWLNSIYALFTISMWVLCELVGAINVEDIAGHPLIKLLNSTNPRKYFFWGLMEQTSSYVLFYILPILLAIKFRTSRNFATMAGTLLGTINLLSYVVHSLSLTIFAQYSFVKSKNHHSPEPFFNPDDNYMASTA